MNLILIRHGRPERIDHDPSGADPRLTDLGHRQAAAMANYLKTAPLDAIYASPMARARETSTPLEGLHGMEPTVIDGLAEFDIGEPSYIPGEEEGPYTPEMIEALFAKMTGAEFTDRVFESMAHIIDNNKGSTVAVVCHGGVISRFLMDVLGTDPTSSYFNTDYTSVTRVRAASSTGARSMQSFNERHWLDTL